jgi:hypothetical protein
MEYNSIRLSGRLFVFEKFVSVCSTNKSDHNVIFEILLTVESNGYDVRSYWDVRVISEKSRLNWKIKRNQENNQSEDNSH